MTSKHLEIASRLTIPTLLVRAGLDKLVSNEASQAFFDALQAPDKKLHTYEGLFHEILNETSKEEIFSYITSWLKNHITHCE